LTELSHAHLASLIAEGSRLVRHDNLGGVDLLVRIEYFRDLRETSKRKKRRKIAIAVRHLRRRVGDRLDFFTLLASQLATYGSTAHARVM
jgi:hypothetical protein